MALDVLCSRCGRPLEEPGALAFAPPTDFDYCKKYHVCQECWYTAVAPIVTGGGL